MSDNPAPLVDGSFLAGPVLAIIGLACLVAALFWLHLKHDVHLIDIPSALWALPFIAPLGIACFWLSGNLAYGDGSGVVALSICALIGGALAATLRKTAFDWLDSRPVASSSIIAAIRDIACIAIVSVLSVISLEIACNGNLPHIPSNSFGLSCGIVACMLAVFYLLGQRHGAPMMIVPLTSSIMGIAEHFVVTFKGEAILPSDILALGTAAEVSSGYDFQFTQDIFFSLALMVVSFTLLSFIRPRRTHSRRALFANVAANTCCCILVAAIAVSGFGNLDIETALGFDFDRWWPISTYTSQGFVTAFTTMLNDLPIDKPEGYSANEAESIQKDLAAQYDAGYGASEQRQAAVDQFDEIHPTVITVMDESFSDLSCYEPLAAAGYTGPAFYNSLPDTLMRGTMLSSVCGGGTANSEFEYLTGNTTAFVGVGKIAYQLYEMSGIDSLAKDLNAIGYKATAMHPQNPINYHRDQVYKQLGFGKFLSADDFADAPWYHAGATDRATFDKILDLLSSDSAPQFIFDVTMQNHGGYDAGTVPAEELTSYTIEGLGDDVLSPLNTYLTCINASDRDLEYFIDALRNLDRPVVLVFFGDHQPSVASSLNDALYPDEDAATHAFRSYQSTYMVWANYEIAGNTELNVNQAVGANEIAALTLEKIGAPLTDYQKAMLVTRDQVPTINVAGYLGADGLRYDLENEDSPYLDVVDKMRRMQYLNFASKVQ